MWVRALVISLVLLLPDASSAQDAAAAERVREAVGSVVRVDAASRFTVRQGGMAAYGTIDALGLVPAESRSNSIRMAQPVARAVVQALGLPPSLVLKEVPGPTIFPGGWALRMDAVVNGLTFRDWKLGFWTDLAGNIVIMGELAELTPEMVQASAVPRMDETLVLASIQAEVDRTLVPTPPPPPSTASTPLTQRLEEERRRGMRGTEEDGLARRAAVVSRELVKQPPYAVLKVHGGRTIYTVSALDGRILSTAPNARTRE